MGDVKCLKDSVCNAGNICSSVSVEEEIAIPGHYGIFKVNGGWINRVVLKVCEQNVDACGARCQGHTNIFGGSEVLEGLNYASRPRGWQQRVSSLMMHVLSKSIVAHRWYMLMVTLDNDMRRCLMSARSPCGTPRFFRIVLLAPHTR
jgi:hypothetical protein